MSDPNGIRYAPNPYCSKSGTGFHDGAAIGYEKLTVPPTYESRGANIAITQGAYYRYFVVRACRHCTTVWWEEDQPIIPEARQPEPIA